MSGAITGAQFVFWCALLGLVVIFCAETVRAYKRSRPPLGPTPNDRLRGELSHLPEGDADDDHPGRAP